MADPNRKRSRKSRLVPRDLDLDTDVDTTKTSTLQVLSRLNSAMARQQSHSPVPDDVDFKVEVECEEVDECQRPVPSSAYLLPEPAHVRNEDLRKEIEELCKITTSAADKTLEIELRNSWGRQMRALALSPLDRALQEVFGFWRMWSSQSRVRDVPLLYKCYTCEIGFWHLTPFKDHLVAKHRQFNVHQESFHHEFNIIAWEGNRESHPKIRTVGVMGGNCGMCLNPHKTHISQWRNSIVYTCLGCREKFYICPALFRHEGRCQRFLQHLVKEGTVIHENRWICTICDIDCLTEERYNGHMIGRHSVRNDTVIGTPLFKTCIICGMKYTLFHMHACYAKSPTIKCQYCFRKFQNKFLLNHHVKFNGAPTRCRTCDHFIPRLCMEVEHVVQHSSTYCLASQCLACHDTLVVFPTNEKLNIHLSNDHGFKAERRKGFRLLVIVPMSIHTLHQLEMPTEESISKTGPVPQVQSKVPYKNDAELQLAHDAAVDHLELESEIKVEEHDVAELTEGAMARAALDRAQNDDEQCFMMESEINMLLSNNRKRKSALISQDEAKTVEAEIIDNAELSIKTERRGSIEERAIEIRDSIEEECGLIEGQIEEMLKKSDIVIKGEDESSVDGDMDTMDREDSIERECREMQEQIDSLLQRQKKKNTTDSDVVVKIEEQECKELQDEIDTLVKKRDEMKKQKEEDETAKASDMITHLLNGDIDDECSIVEEVYPSQLSVEILPNSHNVEPVDMNMQISEVDVKTECVKDEGEESYVEVDIEENEAVIEPMEELQVEEATIALCNIKTELEGHHADVVVTDHDYLRTWAQAVVAESHPTNSSDMNPPNDDDNHQNESDSDNDDLIILESDNHNFVDLTEDLDQEENEDNSTEDTNANLSFESNITKDEEICKENNEETSDIITKVNDETSAEIGIDSVKTNESIGPCFDQLLRKIYQCLQCGFQGLRREFLEHKDTCEKIKRKSPRNAMPTKTVEAGKKEDTVCNKGVKGILKHLASMYDRSRSIYKWPPFKCSSCDVSFKTFRKYIMHFGPLSCKDNEEPVHKYALRQCPKCLIVYDSTSKLLVHVVQHLRSNYVSVQCISTTSSIKSTDGIFQCKTCKANVKILELFQHWESHLVLATVEEETMEESISIRAPVVQGWADAVDVKDKLKPSQLKRILDHLTSTKHGRYDFIKKCQLCQRPFDRRNDCKRHLVEHLLRDAYQSKQKNDGFRCQICHEICRKPDVYKQHMRTHGGLPVYTCELCNKDFSDSSNFTKHKKVHNLGVVVCDICNKKFQTKSSLVKHMEFHETTKPTACKHCDRVFVLPTALKKHIKTAHCRPGDRSYMCVYCRQRFPSIKMKWDHMWEIHKERKQKADCPKCGRSFRKLLDVKRHLKVVHGQSLTCLITKEEADAILKQQKQQEEDNVTRKVYQQQQYQVINTPSPATSVKTPSTPGEKNTPERKKIGRRLTISKEAIAKEVELAKAVFVTHAKEDVTKRRVHTVTTLTKEEIARQAELARLKSLWNDSERPRAVRAKCSRAQL